MIRTRTCSVMRRSLFTRRHVVVQEDEAAFQRHCCHSWASVDRYGMTRRWRESHGATFDSKLCFSSSSSSSNSDQYTPSPPPRPPPLSPTSLQEAKHKQQGLRDLITTIPSLPLNTMPFDQLRTQVHEGITACIMKHVRGHNSHPQQWPTMTKAQQERARQYVEYAHNLLLRLMQEQDFHTKEKQHSEKEEFSIPPELYGMVMDGWARCPPPLAPSSSSSSKHHPHESALRAQEIFQRMPHVTYNTSFGFNMLLKAWSKAVQSPYPHKEQAAAAELAYRAACRAEQVLREMMHTYIHERNAFLQSAQTQQDQDEKLQNEDSTITTSKSVSWVASLKPTTQSFFYVVSAWSHYATTFHHCSSQERVQEASQRAQQSLEDMLHWYHQDVAHHHQNQQQQGSSEEGTDASLLWKPTTCPNVACFAHVLRARIATLTAPPPLYQSPQHAKLKHDSDSAMDVTVAYRQVCHDVLSKLLSTYTSANQNTIPDSALFATMIRGWIQVGASLHTQKQQKHLASVAPREAERIWHVMVELDRVLRSGGGNHDQTRRQASMGIVWEYLTSLHDGDVSFPPTPQPYNKSASAAEPAAEPAAEEESNRKPHSIRPDPHLLNLVLKGYVHAATRGNDPTAERAAEHLLDYAIGLDLQDRSQSQGLAALGQGPCVAEVQVEEGMGMSRNDMMFQGSHGDKWQPLKNEGHENGKDNRLLPPAPLVDRVSCNTVLRILSQSGAVGAPERAESLLTYMEDVHDDVLLQQRHAEEGYGKSVEWWLLYPDAYSYCAVLNAYSLGRCGAFMSKMGQNQSTFTASSGAAASAGSGGGAKSDEKEVAAYRISRAMDVLGRMERRHRALTTAYTYDHNPHQTTPSLLQDVKPNAVVYTSALNVIANAYNKAPAGGALAKQDAYKNAALTVFTNARRNAAVDDWVYKTMLMACHYLLPPSTSSSSRDRSSLSSTLDQSDNSAKATTRLHRNVEVQWIVEDCIQEGYLGMDVVEQLRITLGLSRDASSSSYHGKEGEALFSKLLQIHPADYYMYDKHMDKGKGKEQQRGKQKKAGDGCLYEALPREWSRNVPSHRRRGRRHR